MSQVDLSNKNKENDDIQLYAILELDKTATNDDIKKAYRKLALRYHPDKNIGDSVADEKFKEVNRAHVILSDEKKRRLYDKYGSLGLYIIDHMDEKKWDKLLIFENPCVQCLLITIFLLTGCCCCLCCGKLLTYAKKSPNEQRSNVDDTLTETDVDNPIVNQPVSVAIPVN